MRLNFHTIFCIILITSCSKNENTKEEINCEGEFSTNNVLTNIDEQIYNDDESVNAYSKYSWTSEGTNRILSGNGIPNHEVGTFPNNNNPNTISEQTVSERFTLCPTIFYERGLELVGPALAIAYAINSVKFDPATAGKCNDLGECSLAQGQGNWSIEALGHDTFDFGDDMNHAHVQPNGAYHYHGMPELLMEFLGSNQGTTLVGWASDGFPVYARYGYSNANDSTLIKELSESLLYRLLKTLCQPNTLSSATINSSNNSILLLDVISFKLPTVKSCIPKKPGNNNS